MDTNNPPSIDNTYYKTLPKKYVAAGVLLRNNKNQILLVKPAYKNTWEIPGGITELGESPRVCCKHEVKE